ncbi:hypothetical protein BGZ88_005378 [Linnemannia elongata]|nr:hypothetical protein BGZ88_005378 [Linnemannia elongata]
MSGAQVEHRRFFGRFCKKESFTASFTAPSPWKRPLVHSILMTEPSPKFNTLQEGTTTINPVLTNLFVRPTHGKPALQEELSLEPARSVIFKGSFVVVKEA